MIKLIASDMDGTLLQNGIRQVSREQLSIIKELTDAGIMFAPASGRQYTNLMRNFEPVRDKLIYICENGSFVKYKGETIYKKSLDRNLGLAIMEDIYIKETVARCFCQGRRPVILCQSLKAMKSIWLIM